MIFRYTSIFRGYRIKSTGVIWEQQKNSLQIKKKQSFQIQKDRFVETIKEFTINVSQGPKKHFVQVFVAAGKVHSYMEAARCQKPLFF